MSQRENHLVTTIMWLVTAILWAVNFGLNCAKATTTAAENMLRLLGACLSFAIAGLHYLQYKQPVDED